MNGTQRHLIVEPIARNCLTDYFRWLIFSKLKIANVDWIIHPAGMAMETVQYLEKSPYLAARKVGTTPVTVDVALEHMFPQTPLL